MIRRLVLAVALGTFCGALPARADDWDNCSEVSYLNADLHYDWIIEGCTNVIAARKESGARIAEAFYHRGNAYRGRGGVIPTDIDLDMAIADFDNAIQIKPDYALAFYFRGAAYHNKGDLDRAAADYRMAARLLPESDFIVKRQALKMIALIERLKALEAKPASP